MLLALVISLLWSPDAGSSGGSQASSLGAATIPQDRPAPDFDLPSLSGSGRLTLRSMRGDVVVVNFWASWCAACRQEAPALRQLARSYHDAGVDFVGVDHADLPSSGRAFAGRNGLTYPSVVDSGDVLGTFGAVGLPMTYVVDRGGRIRYELVGTVDAGHLKQAIDRARAQQSS